MSTTQQFEDKDPFAAENEGPSEFEKLLASETGVATNRRYRRGEQVTGTVVSIGKDNVFVDLGGKNAGAIAAEEFTGSGLAIPKTGDELTAYIKVDNGSEVILTRTIRQGDADEGVLRNAFENGIPVEAKVEEVIKGGFRVSLFGKRGFVPQGHMEAALLGEPEKIVGNTLKFTILEFKQGGRNIVLSRRSIVREEQEGKAKEILASLTIGNTYKARITRTADFGAFADLGGVEGLIPLSELAWKRVKKADDVVKPNQEVLVKIMKIEEQPKLRIGLSLKEAGEDPWTVIAPRLSPGEVLDGTVERLADFGAFVSLAEGVEGLVHVSQISWETRVSHPREHLKEKQAVKVHILNVDLEKRKLDLSIKGPMPEHLAEKMKKRQADKAPLSAEEQANLTEWESYKKQSARRAEERQVSSVMAAAFTLAKPRKK